MRFLGTDCATQKKMEGKQERRAEGKDGEKSRDFKIGRNEKGRKFVAIFFIWRMRGRINCGLCRIWQQLVRISILQNLALFFYTQNLQILVPVENFLEVCCCFCFFLTLLMLISLCLKTFFVSMVTMRWSRLVTLIEKVLSCVSVFFFNQNLSWTSLLWQDCHEYINWLADALSIKYLFIVF